MNETCDGININRLA